MLDNVYTPRVPPDKERGPGQSSMPLSAPNMALQCLYMPLRVFYAPMRPELHPYMAPTYLCPLPLGHTSGLSTPASNQICAVPRHGPAQPLHPKAGGLREGLHIYTLHIYIYVCI